MASDPVTQPHSLPFEDVCEALGTSVSGLSETAAGERLQRYGPNKLMEAPQRGWLSILFNQFKSLIVALLAGAAVLSLAFGDVVEALAILVVLAINTAIGFISEMRAVRSMESLRQLSIVSAKVRRDGASRRVPAEELVPGDILLLEAGDIVAADLRLIEVANLQCDESALTGESVPVTKSLESVPADALIGDRVSMAFKGTAVTAGIAEGVVVTTGMNTELGAIASMVESAEAERSPFEKRLDRLGGQLVWATLVVTALIGVAGVLTGQDALDMAKTAIALAIAAIPEGLPIVATLALARGMWRMARRNAVIKSLSSVETLGATTVILTDKTGTLTENHMTVARLQLPGQDVTYAPHKDNRFTVDGETADLADGSPLHTALRIAVLCSNAELGEGETRGIGDPMEMALLEAARAAGLDRGLLAEHAPEIRQEAFGQNTKMMATFHRLEEGTLVAVKGAPEAVLAACDSEISPDGEKPLDKEGRRRWSALNADMAESGLRVLALAQKITPSSEGDPYSGLGLAGLVGLHDPAREDVPDAIRACREAGIRVVMLTGDHKGTARAISCDVGLADSDSKVMDASELDGIRFDDPEECQRLAETPVFARVSPKNKLDLVAVYQQTGEIVAMTGDGVNDAPALRKADIGVAMGQRGTEVARQAADMVLRDDAFGSIVAAIRYGRVIFRNIRQFVIYLMSCNLSEIAVIGLATLSGMPLPLLPLQILFLNLVTDVFPAFALGVGEAHGDVMKTPPRDPKQPVITRRNWVFITAYAALIAGATLAAFAIARTLLGMPNGDALTVSFVTLGLAQLWHVFNMRSRSSGMIRNEVTANKYVWGALSLCVALILTAVHLPELAEILGTVPLGMEAWAVVAGFSLLPLVLVQFGSAATKVFGMNARER